jgi:hypothetical protein
MSCVRTTPFGCPLVPEGVALELGGLRHAQPQRGQPRQRLRHVRGVVEVPEALHGDERDAVGLREHHFELPAAQEQVDGHGDGIELRCEGARRPRGVPALQLAAPGVQPLGGHPASPPPPHERPCARRHGGGSVCA